MVADCGAHLQGRCLGLLVLVLLLLGLLDHQGKEGGKVEHLGAHVPGQPEHQCDVQCVNSKVLNLSAHEEVFVRVSVLRLVVHRVSDKLSDSVHTTASVARVWSIKSLPEFGEAHHHKVCGAQSGAQCGAGCGGRCGARHAPSSSDCD